MRVLVTGATGFIGRKLIDSLLNHGHDICVLVRNDQYLFNKKVKVLFGDLINIEEQILSFSPEYVYHLAGVSNYPTSKVEKEVLWKSNFLFGLELLEIVSKVPDVIFVNFNTSLAYDGVNLNPFNYYALTKVCFFNTLEFYSKKYNFSVFNLILYNVYGNSDLNKRAINYVLDSFGAIEPINMSPGEQILDFIHVDDVVCLCVTILENKPLHKIEHIFVGTGVGFNLKELTKLIEKITNKISNINFGGLDYRLDEKMDNVAPINLNRFWKHEINLEHGIKSLIYKN